MKNDPCGMILGLVVLLIAAAADGSSFASSPHDLRFGSGNTQACNTCHVPAIDTTAPLLWSRTEATNGYSLYGTPPHSTGPGRRPGPTSKICLSCHDGVVGKNDLADNGIGRGHAVWRDFGNFGSSFMSSHPIGIEYDKALSTDDGMLADGATPVAASRYAKSGIVGTRMLFNGKIECSSCHDAHNTLGAKGLLKVSASESRLCFQCHMK